MKILRKIIVMSTSLGVNQSTVSLCGVSAEELLLVIITYRSRLS
jgi:hypothetical protein